MYERIILPIDGAKPALAPLPFAEELAVTWGCPLEVVHVTTGDDLAADAEPEGYEVHRLQSDDPAATLVSEARASDPPALLCMASRGRRPVGEALFGTVTGRVIRELHAPLVVSGPQLLAPSGPPRVTRILVCLDGSTTSASILPTARSWGQELGLEVILSHVAYPVTDPVAGPPTLPEETRVVRAELERTGDEWNAAGIDTRWQVVEDTDAATGIVRQAAHRSVDLVVMATHGRTGLARILVGSVATQVVRQSPVPVLDPTSRTPRLTPPTGGGSAGEEPTQRFEIGRVGRHDGPVNGATLSTACRQDHRQRRPSRARRARPPGSAAPWRPPPDRGPTRSPGARRGRRPATPWRASPAATRR